MSDDTLTLKADREAFALIRDVLKSRKNHLIDVIATLIENDIGSECHEQELHLVEETIRKIKKVME